MQNIFNYIKNFGVLLVLVGLVSVFIFRLRTETKYLPTYEPGQSSYPAPSINDPETELIGSYPVSTNVVDPESLVCNETSEWGIFTDIATGYTINYPESFRSGELPGANGYKSFYIFLGDGCMTCQQGVAIMDIHALDNPDALPIKEFVEQRFIFANTINTPEPDRSMIEFESFNILDNGGVYIEVAGVKAIRIEDTNRPLDRYQIIGIANPIVFVPHGTQVIQFSLGPNGDLEPPFNPCYEIVDMFDQILTSLQLFSPEQ